SLSVDPQSHVSRHGAYLCRPCDRLRRADRLRLAPVGADRDPDAGDRSRGALSRSEVRRRLPPLQGRGSPLALTIPPLPPAGPFDKPAPASLPRVSYSEVAGRCHGKPTGRLTPQYTQRLRVDDAAEAARAVNSALTPFFHPIDPVPHPTRRRHRNRLARPSPIY